MSVFLPKSTFHQGIRRRDLRSRELGTPCSTKRLSPLDHPLKKPFIDTATGKLGRVTGAPDTFLLKSQLPLLCSALGNA